MNNEAGRTKLHRPHGIYPMLYAFFEPDGTLDRNAMRTQVEAMITSGAHGIAVLGLITEVSKLSDAERRTLVEWCVEDIAGRVPLAVTIAGETAQVQIELAGFAIECGADWLVLQPPRETRPSDAELLRFYDTVMARISIPVGIQNAPEYLGVGLSPPDVERLHKQNNQFVVMKGEGPVYQVRRFIDATQGDIAIFNGRGGLELPDNLRAGCSGMIPAPDCADMQIRIYNHFTDGNHGEADTLYQKILPLIVFTMQSVDFAVCYGKILTARRLAGQPGHDARSSCLKPDAFGLEALERHSARLPAKFPH